MQHVSWNAWFLYNNLENGFVCFLWQFKHILIRRFRHMMVNLKLISEFCFNSNMIFVNDEDCSIETTRFAFCFFLLPYQKRSIVTIKFFRFCNNFHFVAFLCPFFIEYHKPRILYIKTNSHRTWVDFFFRLRLLLTILDNKHDEHLPKIVV